MRAHLLDARARRGAWHLVFPAHSSTNQGPDRTAQLTCRLQAIRANPERQAPGDWYFYSRGRLWRFHWKTLLGQ
jgi:hypothetical protein